MSNFTPEHLILFQYGELDEATAISVSNAIETNWSFREKHTVIREAASLLNKAIQSPREEAVQQVLRFARKSLRKEVLEN